MNEDEIAKVVVDSSLKVHTLWGPGLLESIYEACLGHELERRGLTARKQVPMSVVYDHLRFDNAFRIDLLVNGLS